MFHNEPALAIQVVLVIGNGILMLERTAV